MNESSRAVTLGIVGLSAGRGWAAVAHVPALKSLPNFQVRALVASTEESAKRSADHHKVSRHFSSVAELAAWPEVDLIVVAVKTPDHYAAVDAALRAGKNVYCEWPLGNGPTEAEHHWALAQSKGVRTFVGLQGRAAPAIRQVRALLASGYVGEVISTRMVGSVAPFGATVQPDGVYLLDRKNGASLLTIPFGHAVDAMCWCLGEFRELSATVANRWPHSRRSDTGKQVVKTIDDQIAVSGILQGGALASVHYQGGRSRGTEFLWEINGSEGELVVSAGVGLIQMTELRLQGRREGEPTLEDIPITSDNIASPGSPKDHYYALRQAYALVLADLQTGGRTVPDFGAAVVRHRMIDAVQKAADTGTRQSYESS